MTDERPDVRAFLRAYGAAFAASDAPAIADRFSYRLHVTGGGDEVEVTTVAAREAWVAEIARLLAAYRAVGVRSAHMLDVQVIELGARLAQAAVHWELLDEDGGSIYDFHASYTLADLGEGLRITALTHDEAPRLRAAVDRARSAGRGA